MKVGWIGLIEDFSLTIDDLDRYKNWKNAAFLQKMGDSKVYSDFSLAFVRNLTFK